VGNNTKIQKYVDRKELAAFLRELADAVENGGKDELTCVDDFQKVKIAIKNELDRISVKAKIKTAPGEEEAAAESEGGDPKYKPLKKRMKSTFKLLVKTIHEGQVPPREAAEAFLADAALMVTFPGYGDEYYGSFSEACAAFAAAYESGDMERMHAAIDVLVHEKSRCHAKYD